jgi:hypothetical protein
MSSTSTPGSGTLYTVNVRNFGATGNGVTNDFQAFRNAVAAIPAGSSGVIFVPPGTYNVDNLQFLDSLSPCINLPGPNNDRDNISLVGADKDRCILVSTQNTNVLFPVVQACNHCAIRSLTMQSTLGRCVHWDQPASSALTVEDCSFNSGSGNGVSTGVASGSNLIVRNNEFGTISGSFNNNCTMHNSGADIADFAQLWWYGNVFHGNASQGMGIDMTPGTNHVLAYVFANKTRAFNTDNSSGLGIQMNVASPNLLTCYVDDTVEVWNQGSTSKFWNYVWFGQIGYYVKSGTINEGDCVVVTPGIAVSADTGTVAQSSAANQSFPAVALESGASATRIRLATGRYAEVNCDATATAIGDIICTSATAALATTNNAQTDIRKILGWAATSKGAVTGRVTVLLNQSLKW